MRTSCLLPPPVFTPRTAASGVLRVLDPGVRPGVAEAPRLGVTARPGVRLGVREVDAQASSHSRVRPGVSTKHSPRANSLFRCSLCAQGTRKDNVGETITPQNCTITQQVWELRLPDTLQWWSCERCGSFCELHWVWAAPWCSPRWGSPVRSWSGRNAVASACATTFAESWVRTRSEVCGSGQALLGSSLPRQTHPGRCVPATLPPRLYRHHPSGRRPSWGKHKNQTHTFIFFSHPYITNFNSRKPIG